MIIPYKDTKLKVYKDRIVLSKKPVFRLELEDGDDCVFLYESTENSSAVIIVLEDQIEKDGVTIFGKFPNVISAKYFIEADDAKRVETPAIDYVDHPSHYQTESGIEVIDVIDAFTKGLEGVVSFDIGNAIKYVCRWKKKGGVEDLRKAIWYISHAIEREEREK
jgi:hypothetical protein